MEYNLLKDIVEITMGQSPDSLSYNNVKRGLPFYQGNADFGELYPIAKTWCDAPKKTAKKNDILISVRAPIGAINYTRELCCIGRGLAAITVEDDIERNYIYYFLKAKNSELINQGTGSTFKAIGRPVLEMLKVPAISEKQKILIIKSMDFLVDIIKLRKKELILLDELIKARFIEMFYHKGYTVLEWNDVFYTRTGKLDSNASIVNGKYPFFTCSKEILYIDDFAFDQEALLLAGNNAAGKYDVKYYKGKFNAYQRTYILTLRGNWSYQLFRYQLENKLEYLRQQSLGGLTKYLTMKILGELSFIIPPIEKQLEFEDFVRQVDKSRFDIKKSITELEREVVYD